MTEGVAVTRSGFSQKANLYAHSCHSVLQRPFGETTLASAVQLFRCGRDGTQGTTAKRQISMGASAYCRARWKMPTLVYCRSEFVSMRFGIEHRSISKQMA